MYYLNAFNEMLRKRRQNMMGGEGNDYGVGTTTPSGPMGLGPAQDRNAFRDTLNSMSPMSRFAVGMMPVIGPAFNAGRLVDAGISAYQNSQLAPSRDARERAQDQFRASEISEMNAPAYADDSMDRLSFNSPISSPVSQSSFASQDLDPMAPVAFSSPVSQSSVTADNSYGGFGDDTGGSDTMGFAGTYAHGGMVDARHLKGRAPAPDDGYGALQGGEYVITKAAVEKYGKRLLDAINNGTFR
jgi:hypothetical protein